jgi:hypothetical protein
MTLQLTLSNVYYTLGKKTKIMANKTATIAVRIEPAVKKEVEKILEAIELSTSEAVNVFSDRFSLPGEYHSR